MQAFEKRIVFFLFVVTLLSFMYEQNYEAQTDESTGIVNAISHPGKAKVMTIAFSDKEGRQKVFSVGMNIVDSVSNRINVGDKVPVIYCDSCLPMAKIARFPYSYLLTAMLLVLDIIFLIVLVRARKSRIDTRKHE